MKIFREILEEISAELDIEIDGSGDFKQVWDKITTEGPGNKNKSKSKVKIDLEKNHLNEKKALLEVDGEKKIFTENDFEGDYIAQEYKPKKYDPKEKSYKKENGFTNVHDGFDYDNKHAYENKISEQSFSDDLTEKLRNLQNPQNAREAFVYSLIFDRRGRFGNNK